MSNENNLSDYLTEDIKTFCARDAGFCLSPSTTAITVSGLFLGMCMSILYFLFNCTLGLFIGRSKNPLRSLDPSIIRGLQNNDPAVRQDAVASPLLTDQIVLAAIARRDRSPYVRMAAVRKIKDPGVLAHIANTDGEYVVRLFAASMHSSVVQGLGEMIRAKYQTPADRFQH